MKIKQKFVVRQIAGDTVLVPISDTVSKFNGLIMLNEVGLFIWNNLESVSDENELLERILEEYDVDELTAKNDMIEFLDVLKKAEII